MLTGLRLGMNPEMRGKVGTIKKLCLVAQITVVLSIYVFIALISSN